MYEFTYESLTEAQVQAYLDRIGFCGPHTCSKENLDQLVYLHQCHIVFENLDVYYKQLPLALDAGGLFDKIITRGRGGFCFELNGLFVLLLRALGYDAYSCVCRVAANRTELGNLAHRAVIVTLDGKTYICDVGLGGPMPPFAVEISEAHQTQRGETTWVEPTEMGWYLQRRLTKEGAEANIIIFGMQAFLAKDFIPLCTALTDDPNSVFRTNLMVNLRRPDGYHRLRNGVLTLESAEGKEERTITDAELPAVLKEYFFLPELDFLP